MPKDLLPGKYQRISRRKFIGLMGAYGITVAFASLAGKYASAQEVISIKELQPSEDVFAYIDRVKGTFDQTFFQQVIGASNTFKEGDQTIGVGARDEATWKNAQALLANTRIKDLYEHPLFVDDLQQFIWNTTDLAQYEKVKDWTMGELKTFLLTKSEDEIKGIMYGLTSDTIGCVPKLMTNEELILLGQKIFGLEPCITPTQFT
ncbi:ethanolamine ammonia-lyase subunit EutB [Desulfocastanea catecholica]